MSNAKEAITALTTAIENKQDFLMFVENKEGTTTSMYSTMNPLQLMRNSMRALSKAAEDAAENGVPMESTLAAFLQLAADCVMRGYKIEMPVEVQQADGSDPEVKALLDALDNKAGPTCH